MEEVLYDKTEEEEKLKMDEIASLIRIKEEKKRDEVRKSHVRPWDEGKSKAKNYDTDSDDSDDNKEWEPKREYEPMSQQQWNEKKRSERSSDFAPPVLESNIPKKPKETLTYSHEISEDAINSYLQAQRLEKSLIFTSKAKPQFKRKNYEAASNSVEDELLPPKVPKLDTPTTSVPFPEVSNDQLEKSIAAGLRFLRDQSDKGDIKNKNIWASRKEY